MYTSWSVKNRRYSPLCSVNTFSPWFLPSLALENRGLDLALRAVRDPDVRARSLVCCAPMVTDHHYRGDNSSGRDGGGGQT